MTRLVQLPESARLARTQHGFFREFDGFLTAGSTADWTLVTAVDGTATNTDGVGGIITIVNGVATIGDNEDTYLVKEPEAFLWAANKPLIFGAYTRFDQVSTSSVNTFVGLTDAAAANLLVNDGAGPKTSGTSAAFFTKDGSLSMWIHASLSTTQTSIELTAANSLDKTAHLGASSSFQLLEIEFVPKSSTQADLIYFIEGVPVYKISDYVYTSATEMQAVIGIKGGTAAAANIVADYCYTYQVR